MKCSYVDFAGLCLVSDTLNFWVYLRDFWPRSDASPVWKTLAFCSLSSWRTLNLWRSFLSEARPDRWSASAIPLPLSKYRVKNIISIYLSIATTFNVTIAVDTRTSGCKSCEFTTPFRCQHSTRFKQKGKLQSRTVAKCVTRARFVNVIFKRTL